MYLTMKQQVKHLSKEEYHSIKELCHIAKNLANQAIYNVRQYYFTEGEYLNYEKNYSLLKTSDNYKMLNSNISPCLLIIFISSFQSNCNCFPISVSNLKCALLFFLGFNLCFFMYL